MENEQDKNSSFRDELKTDAEKELRPSVYRKEIFTGQYLNFNSHH